MGDASPQPRAEAPARPWPYQRALLILLCFVLAAAAGYHARNLYLVWQEIDFEEPEPMLLEAALTSATACVYILLLASLFLIRLPLVAKLAELWPRALAFVGSFLPFAVTFFPPAAWLSLELHVIASAVSLVGMGLAVVILTWLGRSFSITPQARRLVTTGPYRFVRHPLYVAEYVASLGVLVHFLSPWTVLITLIQGYVQLQRMVWEERILARAFPDYAAYARRTARIIPGLY
ncbi:MAG TPA: isoprenylcysteine carboxylmethyltransferase family protein [Alphaproteobacteria bacterium]|nr:isoprenylcysteine carboxylmethyltransferase family protein [Alphaproteobacteria bacterium]